mmetsp:Transcript_32861/g.33480  ORF Transcript_32861/g.33480 Transcript_32861/m.33480 type:complete len:239 (+) Transcript_32861:148-864(+)
MSSLSDILPPFLGDKDEILVPIKIDITHKGARFVDSFTWNLRNPILTADDFAIRTCLDLNLPEGFIWKISLQIQEQVKAYSSLISLFALEVINNKDFAEKSHELQPISIGIRHNIVDYSDKFLWDMYSPFNSPEKFARTTCLDLGLPAEMESPIAHRIRETLIRNMITWLEDSSTLKPHTVPLTPSEVKVSVVQPHQVVDMVTNLWKRAKPTVWDEQAALPQPKLPKHRDTNARVWRG